jgi:hypothetical protein
MYSLVYEAKQTHNLYQKNVKEFFLVSFIHGVPIFTFYFTFISFIVFFVLFFFRSD